MNGGNLSCVFDIELKRIPKELSAMTRVFVSHEVFRRGGILILTPFGNFFSNSFVLLFMILLLSKVELSPMQKSQ